MFLLSNYQKILESINGAVLSHFAFIIIQFFNINNNNSKILFIAVLFIIFFINFSGRHSWLKLIGLSFWA
ncbi:hypothetical protein A7985_22645 [Pseudoalteromonas luteoviolacea]|uniref:Uncharacterized protein n=1 Tax=Pseudoalteromonas luteoviolacea TaxID=43657 RepID=A0A1C0TJS2_9GAMM|nr:hypothetical protein A7985_22645 [Pseudoalteromonas luteoviolacea]